jgi:hypothetical protein
LPDKAGKAPKEHPGKRRDRVAGLCAYFAAEQIEWSGWVYLSMIILVPLHHNFLKQRIREAQKK